MAKEFWFPFYPAKWMTDAELRRCSKRARATWIDILCLMFDAESKGVLRTGSEAWSLEEIASSIPGNAAENLDDIRELLTKNAASREDGTGALMCRSMFDAWQLSNARRAAGSQGGRPRKANQKQNESKPITKTISKPLNVIMDVGIDLSGKGVQGETQPGPDPPEGTFAHFVPDGWLPLLDAWAGRRIMPLQVEMLGERIQRFGESLVKRALEMHVKAGKAHGNLTYLDKILEGGAQERGEVQQDEIARGVAKAVERQRRKRDGS